MTELYIDNNPVVLSDDLSFDFFQKNPAFTRQGEYTYDIDIDLKIPQNAQIYYHLDRLHVEQLHKNRRATLIVECKVLVVGLEIILSVENHIAKIQIISGYSELNYLASDGKKIRDLDFGMIPEINAAMARESLNHIYPDINYSFPQIYDQYFVSTSTERNYFNELNRVAPSAQDLSYVEGARFVAQPYLLYYVEKLVELLGYSLEENDLRSDDMACRLLCINGVSTRNYNEMIPNWEINKFLTEVETFFNVVFISDKITKKVRISGRNSYYKNSSETIIERKNVLKEIKKTYNVEESVNTDYRNVEYKDINSDEYKYYHINKETIKACSVIDFNTYSELSSINIESYYNKLVLFHVVDIDTDFIVRRGYGVNTQYSYFLYPVNQFKPIVDDSKENSVKLSIAPAEIYMITNLRNIDNFEKNSVIFAPIPYARNRGASTTLKDKLEEYIQNGIEENELTGSLYIAIYEGIKSCNYPYDSSNNPERNAFFPICVNYPFMYASGRWTWNQYYSSYLIQFGEISYSLSLDKKTGLINRYFSNDMKVDVSVEYTINFMSPNGISQLDIFIIDNKKFLCKQLKYKISANGMDKVVEGIFYAM